MTLTNMSIKLLTLLLGKERLIWFVVHVNTSWNMLDYTILIDATPKQLAATIPVIKFSHDVYTRAIALQLVY